MKWKPDGTMIKRSECWCGHPWDIHDIKEELYCKQCEGSCEEKGWIQRKAPEPEILDGMDTEQSFTTDISSQTTSEL